jgi:hypothetical protein
MLNNINQSIMEKKISKKQESYMCTFKDNIRDKAELLGLKNDQMNVLLQYIYDYEKLSFGKEDFTKRKRVKNVVPMFELCCAKRANESRCTRRKKDGSCYCGTHMKGTPHGIIDDQEGNKEEIQKVEVWAQDIMGIIYYIDSSENVYQAEDIISNKQNPKVIAKYVKTTTGFSIPEFGI